jgi:hypothetical protein
VAEGTPLRRFPVSSLKMDRGRVELLRQEHIRFRKYSLYGRDEFIAHVNATASLRKSYRVAMERVCYASLSRVLLLHLG